MSRRSTPSAVQRSKALAEESARREYLQGLGVKQIKKMLVDAGEQYADLFEKKDLIEVRASGEGAGDGWGGVRDGGGTRVAKGRGWVGGGHARVVGRWGR